MRQAPVLGNPAKVLLAGARTRLHPRREEGEMSAPAPQAPVPTLNMVPSAQVIRQRAEQVIRRAAKGIRQRGGAVHASVGSSPREVADVQAKTKIAEARSGGVSAAQATIPARSEHPVDYLHGKCGPLARRPDARSTGAEISAAGVEGHDGAGGSSSARTEHTKCVTLGCDRPKPPAAAPAVCDVYIVQVVCVCVRVCVCVCVCVCACCVCVCIYTHTNTHTHTHIHS
jgi:hypothetical protein